MVRLLKRAESAAKKVQDDKVQDAKNKGSTFKAKESGFKAKGSAFKAKVSAVKTKGSAIKEIKAQLLKSKGCQKNISFKKKRIGCQTRNISL